jgi:hypothetical protein
VKVIETRYVGSTNFKPARIIARAEGVKSVTISYDDGFSPADNHRIAAHKLNVRQGWKHRRIGGTLRNGMMVWVAFDPMDGAFESDYGDDK